MEDFEEVLQLEDKLQVAINRLDEQIHRLEEQASLLRQWRRLLQKRLKEVERNGGLNG